MASFDSSTGSNACVLIGGTFAILVQVFLVIVVSTTLLVKWSIERPRRPRRIFIFDVLKQGIGAGTGHLLNILIALFLSSVNEGSNECAWYSLNHTIDTFVGIPISYVLLKAYEMTIGIDYPRTGEYFDETTYRIDFWKWFRQAWTWILIVVLTKAILLFPLYLFSGILARVGSSIFHPLDPYPRTELIFVMIIWPSICNSFQFYVIDSFLKRKSYRDVDADSASEVQSLV